MEIKNKIAIVTGASSGIGLSTAEVLTKQGAKVALVARSKKALEQLSKKLPNSLVVVCDMADETAVKKMVTTVSTHYGRIDILVNNAGRGYGASLIDIESEKLHALFDLNIVGPVVAMQAVIPIMKKQKAGSIINISSSTAVMAIPGLSAYSSLKRALVGLSLTARAELAADHINVSVIYPYITDTNFYKNSLQSNQSAFIPSRNRGGDKLPAADAPEVVAEKIVEAITSEKAEVFVHEWTKGR